MAGYDYDFALGPAPLSDQQYAALAARPGWRRDLARPARGVHLRGLVRPPHHAGGPWLLFFAGNGPGQLEGGQQVLERIAGGRDWGLATWSCRGFDGSRGAPSMGAYNADAVFLYERLQSHFGASPRDVVPVGFSMGSGPAASLLRHMQARRQPARAGVFLGPFLSSRVRGHGPWRRLLPPERVHALELLGGCSTPLFVGYGERDESLPPGTHARPMVRALGPGVLHRELAGGSHTSPLNDSGLATQVAQFIELAVSDG